MDTDDNRTAKHFLQEFIAAYRAARLQGGSIRASQFDSAKVKGSKPGSAHLTFGADAPIADRMLRSAWRWLDVWKREAEERPVSPVKLNDRSSKAYKAQQRAILGEVGLPAVDVASICGTTEGAVKSIRANARQDPETGQRRSDLDAASIDGRPLRCPTLTAPAQVTQGRLEERHADGEVIA